MDALEPQGAAEQLSAGRQRAHGPARTESMARRQQASQQRVARLRRPVRELRVRERQLVQPVLQAPPQELRQRAGWASLLRSPL